MCVYRWMLTEGRLATIYSHYLPVCLCWADPVFLSSAPTLPWYRSWACPLLHFSLVRKWDVAERESGEGERKRKKRFSLQLLSVADTGSEKDSRSEPRHFFADTFRSHSGGETPPCLGATWSEKGWRKRAMREEEDRETGVSSYILMTQAAAPPIPVPWHCRDMAWWHTRTLWMLRLLPTWQLDTALPISADKDIHLFVLELPHTHSRTQQIHQLRYATAKYGTRDNKPPPAVSNKHSAFITIQLNPSNGLRRPSRG